MAAAGSTSHEPQSRSHLLPHRVRPCPDAMSWGGDHRLERLFVGEADSSPSRGQSGSWGAAPRPSPGLHSHGQVAEILQGLYQELPSIVKNILQTMMKAVTVLGTQHTQETVEVMLSLCHPSER